MQPFLDALEQRTPTGAAFRSREWAAVAPAIRQRAFFSATITSARVLTRWRSILLDYLAAETEEVTTPDGRTEIAYKESGLGRFRDRAAEMLISEGLATPADFKDARISNPISNARLQLVFNTNIEQAQTFALWQRSVTNPGYLNQFPAARFVRSPGARIKRERHVQAEGEVRRWDDFAFWQYQNAADIGGFGVPWGPFGFNSYMRQEPVKRREAEKLGLVRPGEQIMPPDLTQFGITPAKQFNAGVEATVDDIPPEIRQKAIRTIQERLGPQVLTPDGKLTLEAIRRARGLPPGGAGQVAKKVPTPAPARPAPPAQQLPAAQPRRTYRSVVQSLDPLYARDTALRQEYTNLVDEHAAARTRMEALGVVDKTTREYAEAQENAARLRLAMAESLKKHQALIEEAREAVSIPAGQRGKLAPTFESNVTPALRKSPSFNEGLRIVERFTAKSLLPQFSVKLNKQKRPFADGRQVNINSSTSASVVAHEITHVTETSSQLYQKAKDFLLKRAKGQQPQRLNRLTGLRQYDNDEVAYEDDWVRLGGNAYSGKLYRSLKSTEILTVGIERLQADPLKFFRTDPEYFEFVVKTLQDLP